MPAELTDLNFLAFLDLSNNHLVGEIPHGSQFDTFTNDSYEGNLGLCGLPLSKKCGPEPEQHHSPPSTNNILSEEKFEFGWMWICDWNRHWIFCVFNRKAKMACDDIWWSA
jgi:hypothetical protein